MNRKHLVNLIAFTTHNRFVAAALQHGSTANQTSAPGHNNHDAARSDRNRRAGGYQCLPCRIRKLSSDQGKPARHLCGRLPLFRWTLTPIPIFQTSTLTDTQKHALTKNGFVVTPPTSDPNKMFMEFYQAYESIRYEQTPLFVTTDSIFHVYHLIFDKMLRDLERQ